MVHANGSGDLTHHAYKVASLLLFLSAASGDREALHFVPLQGHLTVEGCELLLPGSPRV